MLTDRLSAVWAVHAGALLVCSKIAARVLIVNRWESAACIEACDSWAVICAITKLSTARSLLLLHLNELHSSAGVHDR